MDGTHQEIAYLKKNQKISVKFWFGLGYCCTEEEKPKPKKQGKNGGEKVRIIA